MPLLLPPLSLYIHIPWCVRKCPYCDFNSHTSPQELPEQAYIAALLADLDQDLAWVNQRTIRSIFIGGGTPSLFSGAAYQQLFTGLRQRLNFATDIEVTLEANPATIEHDRFEAYLEAGINRLSLGIQSFNPEHLQRLGRVHNREQAENAIRMAQRAGFHNINLDLMHGLPEQTLTQALEDIDCALSFNTTHLSWYQLTIEPNTVFYRQQPILPDDDTLWAIQEAGQHRLASVGLMQYEVSAYSQNHPSQHNLNYWQFGDYLGIGAGAHGKVTTTEGIWRYRKTRLPKDYLQAAPLGLARSTPERSTDNDLVFEFMMNALRLREGVPAMLFSERTGLALSVLDDSVSTLRHQGLMVDDTHRLACTALGFNYLNDVLSHFLVDGES